MTNDISRLTRALRSGLHSDTQFGAVVPPLYLSTNFTFESLGRPRQYDYTRSGNPTRDLLSDAIATLEGGAGCVVVATGMAAVTAVLEPLVPVGGRVIAPHDCYGGTWRQLTWLSDIGRLRVDFVDLTDTAALNAALAVPADLLWVETPSNPLMRVTDIAAVSAAAHAKDLLVVADNTFCSPLLQRPIEHGADVVIHSTTKFLNGHSDIVGGAVVSATPELHEHVAKWANCLGLTGSPFDAFLTLRGLRTLDARMRVHQENTAAVVDLLLNHPVVTTVNYPGLESHPGHQIAKRQQDGFGSLLSFEVSGGQEAVARLVDGLRCYELAESLGGVESLISHPATMTHASMTDQARATAGITGGLVRVSVGIEAADDLVNDLCAGLDRAASSQPPAEPAGSPEIWPGQPLTPGYGG